MTHGMNLDQNEHYTENVTLKMLHWKCYTGNVTLESFKKGAYLSPVYNV